MIEDFADIYKVCSVFCREDFYYKFPEYRCLSKYQNISFTLGDISFTLGIELIHEAANRTD